MDLIMKTHKNIINKLDNFVDSNKIPNILFYGNSGTGKSTLLHYVLDKFYKSRAVIKKYVMYINCSHYKGIKFIRDDLKYFAKTHISNHESNYFKSIVLFNAENLTVDAQSALRRCIEVFNHNTRFFVIVKDKEKLLKPILSRFCDIYVSPILINNQVINLYKYNIEKNYRSKHVNLEKKTKNLCENYLEMNNNNICKTALQLVDEGYFALDLLKSLENMDIKYDMVLKERLNLIVFFRKMIYEVRNEEMLIHCILLNILHSEKIDLKNK
jgi:DNA polymerase III delta prime subunit